MGTIIQTYNKLQKFESKGFVSILDEFEKRSVFQFFFGGGGGEGFRLISIL
jgi:hypothetical protein